MSPAGASVGEAAGPPNTASKSASFEPPNGLDVWLLSKPKDVNKVQIEYLALNLTHRC